MSVFKPILVVSFIIVFFLLAAGPGLAQGPTWFTEPTEPPAFAPGEIVVKFKPHIDTWNAQRSLRAKGLPPLEVLPYGGMLRVQTTPGHEGEAIAELMARGDVEFATLNYYIEAINTPNDPYYASQWALPKIQAPAAWDLYTGGDTITIAVIDTGVDLDHPDLQVKIVPGYDYVNKDFTPDDDNGHGTHVAGIAAASSHNGLGVAGVSWGAKIMPLKVLSASGGGSTVDMTQAVYYAVDHGAKIINLSVGARGTRWPCNWPDVDEAFTYAVDHGVLVVVAAGNDGQNGVNCPGAYDQVMAVGSTTSTDTRPYFSNYGDRLDIAAPGDGIYSTIIGSYGYKNGTSMATPHVAGLAALLWSFDPSLTAAEVRDLIQDTADDLSPSLADNCGAVYSSYVGQPGWDPCFGYGRINAWRTLESASFQTNPAQLNLVIDNYSGPVTGNIQVTSINPQVITWTAVISPTVPWLSVSSPLSGTVSMALSPAQVDLLATTATLTYTDTPITTTLLISGVTSAGITIGPKVTQVQLTYTSHLNRYYLPIIQNTGPLPWIVPLNR